MSIQENDKTVYVLGAGFSAGAGLPMQSQVLGSILSRLGYSFSGILASEHEKAFQKSLDKKIDKIEKFIRLSFPHLNQQLEDIFTLLDQTIESNSHFKGLDSADLQDLRKTWIEVLVGYFHALSVGYLQSDNSVCQRFVAALLKQKVEHGQEMDPCCVVSLNWDSIIEDSFFDLLRVVKGCKKADIDYCVYTTPFDESSIHTPSTKQKAAGIFNLKVLKIHGSTTWLRCPNSNHIYTGLGSPKNPYEIYVCPRKSPFIEKYPDSDKNSGAPFLEPFVITPTYAKVFDQPHIQTTWHNAYVELREASKVVFIGYSLPEADYHFRTLLRRAVRDSTTIEVILYEEDEPKFSEKEEPDLVPEGTKPYDLEEFGTICRYRNLFGSERLRENIRYDGMKAFIDKLLPEEDYQATLKFLKAKLSKHKTFEDLRASG